MTGLELVAIATVAACLAYVVRYVWAIADSLAASAGDHPEPPRPGGPPEDVDPSPDGWDDFTLGHTELLDLLTLTERTTA